MAFFFWSIKMISGSLVALVTPMHDDGTVDWESLDSLLRMHMEQGTGGIVAVGTTGESATLSVSEHCDVIARSVAAVAGRIPVIAGTGANNTTEAIELTAAAQRVGADACLLVTPYYNKPTQEGLYRHFRKIAESVPIPQILYNVPGRTGVNMLPSTVARLADIENIVGIKEATGDLDQGRQVLEQVAGRMEVYSGDDPTAMELMLMGGKGNISVTANVAPRAMADLCAAAMDGQREQAQEIHDRLSPLNEALFLESNPIPVKWALQRMGKMGGGIRLPMTPLDAQFHPAVESALRDAGVLA
jgi:4-hydroxy-tetrahydrodipicolinate synthase